MKHIYKIFLFITILLNAKIVLAATDVTATVLPAGTSLDLSTNASGLDIITVNTTWTFALFPKDIKVFLRSLNNGKIQHTTATGAGTFVNYQVAYKTTGPVTLTTADTQFALIDRGAAAGSDSTPIKITYTGTPFANLRAGNYADTIVVTVNDN